MPTYTSPGLYLEEVQPVRAQEWKTAIPAFLGYVRSHQAKPVLLRHWPQFAAHFGDPLPEGHLGYAVRGFFENGGTVCYVVPMRQAETPQRALMDACRAVEALHDPDLICAPDLAITHTGERRSVAETAALQAFLIHPGPEFGDSPTLRHMLILDSPAGLDLAAERKYCAELIGQAKGRGATELELAGAALYYPWIAVPRFIPPSEPPGVGEKVDTVFTPPSGHIAGVFARSDAAAGIRKAPANEALAGVLDTEVRLSDNDQGQLFIAGDQDPIPPGAVNCLRAFPGRGIRIWGARTLSSDVEWRYINVRRLFLNAIRWMEKRLADLVFEPSGPDLWARIRRELNAYCYSLYQGGALKGATINEAFYVRCDEHLNSRELRDQGIVLAEVGLAAARPYEFIIIRLIQRDGGISLTGAITGEI